jgi:alkanesulfonate monooxygenase SsuD/methylene tetrahydromethanopterin reductase-like flavin-dependent oxidoreductase (luciferase family)
MMQAFDSYRENFQPTIFLSELKTMACVNTIAADIDEEAQFLSSSFYQFFLNLIRNDRKALQAPVAYLNEMMNEEHAFM